MSTAADWTIESLESHVWLPEEFARHTEGKQDVRLVLLRQSDTSGADALRSLAERTYMLYPELPGWQKLIDAGAEPLLSPHLYPEAQRWTLPDGGRAALWWHESTFVLLALGSIAKSDLSDPTVDSRFAMEDNAIASLLRDVIKTIRPIEVCVGPFDRTDRRVSGRLPTSGPLTPVRVTGWVRECPELPMTRLTTSPNGRDSTDEHCR